MVVFSVRWVPLAHEYSIPESASLFGLELGLWRALSHSHGRELRQQQRTPLQTDRMEQLRTRVFKQKRNTELLGAAAGA